MYFPEFPSPSDTCHTLFAMEHGEIILGDAKECACTPRGWSTGSQALAPPPPDPHALASPVLNFLAASLDKLHLLKVSYEFSQRICIPGVSRIPLPILPFTMTLCCA